MGTRVQEALAAQVDHGGEERTLRVFLHDLLREVWNEGEAFDGKRPFGDGDWEYDVYLALVRAGLAEGSEDQWGEIENLDEAAAHDLVGACIDAVFG